MWTSNPRTSCCEDRFVRDRFVKCSTLVGKVNRTRSDTSGSEAVTIPVTQTNPGAVIGTTGYMSLNKQKVPTLIRAQISSVWVWSYMRSLRVSNRSKVERTVTRGCPFWITNHLHCFNTSRRSHDNSNALYPKHWPRTGASVIRRSPISN